MATIRKDETFDGRCTVFIGDEIVISDLTREQADRLIASYQSATT